LKRGGRNKMLNRRTGRGQPNGGLKKSLSSHSFFSDTKVKTLKRIKKKKRVEEKRDSLLNLKKKFVVDRGGGNEADFSKKVAAPVLPPTRVRPIFVRETGEESKKERPGGNQSRPFGDRSYGREVSPLQNRGLGPPPGREHLE